MTNKAQLQQELLAKVKAGIKPSDLKKLRRIIKPKSPKDEGYSSGEEQIIPKAPPLPNTQIQALQAQISSLQKQFQVYKDFKNTDLKLKEQYKETIADLQRENSELTKTIEVMKNQAKNQSKNKPETNEPKENKTFTCSECNQAKSQEQLSRVFGKFSFCLECSKQARQIATQQKQSPPVEEFICHLCSKGKKEVPVRMKLDQTLQPYLICQECRPTAKEFNEADLITDELWEKYPYASASEILEKEFGIVRNKE